MKFMHSVALRLLVYYTLSSTVSEFTLEITDMPTPYNCYVFNPKPNVLMRSWRILEIMYYLKYDYSS